MNLPNVFINFHLQLYRKNYFNVTKKSVSQWSEQLKQFLEMGDKNCQQNPKTATLCIIQKGSILRNKKSQIIAKICCISRNSNYKIIIVMLLQISSQGYLRFHIAACNKLFNNKQIYIFILNVRFTLDNVESNITMC